MEIVRSVTTPHPVIRSCRYNEACEYALTTGSDRTIKLWNPITSALLKTYSGHSQDVLDAVSSLDNAEIVSAGGDKAVYLYDVITGVIKRRFLGESCFLGHYSFEKMCLSLVCNINLITVFKVGRGFQV